jgi:dipeptidase D
VEHDFNTDPIIPYIKDGWIKAKGTTLGADDGIGIAVQLAILESNEIGHGPLECLFTVDEETGLTGAFGLSSNFLQGRILLNLDSEDEGELFIGCAGGIDTMITMGYEKVMPEADHVAFRISVTGLMGGHSGDDIHRGRGNANKILNRIYGTARKCTRCGFGNSRGKSA